MKTLNPGYTDTAIAENPVLTRGKLNFEADFRIKKEAAGELVLTNITSPLDRPEEILLNVTDIKNVYEKTSVDPSAYSPSRRGINLYSKLTNHYSLTDSEDADFLNVLPISVSITVRTPASEYVTPTVIQTVVARAVSTLYDTGSESTTRLGSILRGALKPADL